MKPRMNEKTGTILIVAALYVVSALAGAALFFTMPGAVLWRALAADLLMTLLIWIASLPLHNASVYDPYWSVIPPVLIGFAVVDAGSIAPAAAVLFLALAVWSVRLTWNWASLWTGFHDQDWRYVMIRAKAPKLWPLTSFIGVMLFPTLIVFAQLAGVFALAETETIGAWTLIGAGAILAGAAIQWFADRQMAAFRERNGGRRRCIEEGLWKYSRHPNYFGEVVVWWGVYAIRAGAVGRLDLFVLAPVLMTLMFLFISIPMMEKKLAASRPEYAAYRRRVSMLVPFVRRREADGESEKPA